MISHACVLWWEWTAIWFLYSGPPKEKGISFWDRTPQTPQKASEASKASPSQRIFKQRVRLSLLLKVSEGGQQRTLGRDNKPIGQFPEVEASLPPILYTHMGDQNGKHSCPTIRPPSPIFRSRGHCTGDQCRPEMKNWSLKKETNSPNLIFLCPVNFHGSYLTKCQYFYFWIKKLFYRLGIETIIKAITKPLHTHISAMTIK